MPRIPFKRYELIISLLATGLRTGEIAERLNITRQALADMMKTPAFKDLYKSIQAELLTGAKDVMISGTIAASKLMTELVDNDRYEMRDRLAAAKFLAETGNRFLDKLDEKAADDNDELIPVDRR